MDPHGSERAVRRCQGAAQGVLPPVLSQHHPHQHPPPPVHHLHTELLTPTVTGLMSKLIRLGLERSPPLKVLLVILLLTCSLDSVSVIGFWFKNDNTWIALHSSGLNYFIPRYF